MATGGTELLPVVFLYRAPVPKFECVDKIIADLFCLKNKNSIFAVKTKSAVITECQIIAYELIGTKHLNISILFMKAKSLMVGVAIAMSAQFANAQYWGFSNGNLITAKNSSAGNNNAYVGIGTNASTSYRLYVSGSTLLSGSTRLNVANTMLKVATDNNASELQFGIMNNESNGNSKTNTIYSYQCQSQYSCGATDLALKAKRFYFNYGDVNVAKNLDVKGKITCHNEIEVTAMNAGSINAKDINVELPAAADYVFEDNYNLKSLSEVESYVKENKHLPGMPSASEFAEKGMSVSEMSNKLLEKVEELTLHMIQLEKENKALKAEMELMKK